MNIYNYCTYITFYKGNKLPPFYIGSGTVSKIQNKHKPYFGSVRSKKYKQIWVSELKQNPHLFTIKMFKFFETRKEALEYEEYIHNKLDVVKNPMYTNQATAKGKFLSVGKQSKETCRKKSISLKGNTNALGNKQSKEHTEKFTQFAKSPRSEKHKQNISEALLNVEKLTCPWCNKRGQKQNMLLWHFANCKFNPNAIPKRCCCITCKQEISFNNLNSHYKTHR
nr:MAG: hypothetical protein [Caudoviricetes sp.]